MAAPGERVIRATAAAEDAALAGDRVVWAEKTGACRAATQRCTGRIVASEGGRRKILGRITSAPIEASGGDFLFHDIDVVATGSRVGFAEQVTDIGGATETVVAQQATLLGREGRRARLASCDGADASCIGWDLESGAIDASDGRIALAVRAKDGQTAALVVGRTGRRRFIRLRHLPRTLALAGRWLAVSEPGSGLRVSVYDWTSGRRVSRFSRTRVGTLGSFDLQSDGTLAALVQREGQPALRTLGRDGRVRAIALPRRDVEMAVFIRRDRIAWHERPARGVTVTRVHDLQRRHTTAMRPRDRETVLRDFDGRRALWSSFSGRDRLVVVPVP